MLDEFRSTNITWDKATRRIYSPISANESDSNGRKLNIQVVNSGQVENLTGATLHLYWETKDKTQHGLDAFTASDISKGEFEIFYTTGMLSNIGELNATLVLVDATGKVVSDWFKITVARGINESAIESENSFTTLTQALIDISNLEQNYAPRLNDLTAQLQQTVTIVNDGLERAVNSVPDIGTYPVLPPLKNRIIAPLDGSLRNYIAVDGVAQGDIVFEDVLFGKGARLDTNKRVTFALDSTQSMDAGTVFMRFKTLQDFNATTNTYYSLFDIRRESGQTCVSAVLNYEAAQPYKGIIVTIRNGDNLRLLSVPNIDFNNQTIHTLAVTWKFKTGEGEGNLSVYLNGRLTRATTFSALTVPSNGHQLQLGNLPSLNRPANMIFESLFYSGEFLETAGILELDRKPLNFNAIYNKNTYIKDYVVSGYKREVLPVAVMATHNNVLYGVLNGVISTSHDNGVTWQQFHSFGTSSLLRIDVIDFIDDDLFVSVRDGGAGTSKLYKTALATIDFREVLNFYSGFNPISGWTFDTWGLNIVVAEYGTATQPARVFLSRDKGETFTVIKSLPLQSNHVHGAKFDTYTGRIWITWGDVEEGIEYSSDWGATWNALPISSDDQSTGMIFTKDFILFGSDSVAGATHLRLFDKSRLSFSRLSNPTFKYLNHVYALDLIDGLTWWFGNREQMTGKVNTIYISSDFGVTPILLEDLGNELVTNPYQFVKSGGYVYLGNSKITIPALKQSTN